MVEEFYPDGEAGAETEVDDVSVNTSLKAKLERMAAMRTGGAS